MKKTILSAILLIQVALANAQSPNFEWVKTIGGYSSSNSLKVDASGNVYSIGSFAGTMDFNPDPLITYNLTSVGPLDVFITKYDNVGNFIWAKAFGGAGNDIGNSIWVDVSGNVYTTGYFSGAVDFNPGLGTYTLTSVGIYDVFISKLDPFGNFMWAKSFGGNGDHCSGNGITVDASGNVYTTGRFESFYGLVDFDPNAGIYNLGATGVGGYLEFVSKLDAMGNFVWAKAMGSNNNTTESNSIVLDAFGNVYTTGLLQSTGSNDFDPGSAIYNIPTTGQYSPFVSKLDNTGNFVWAKVLGGNNTNMNEAKSIVIDLAGNIFIGGIYYGGPFDANPDPVGVYNLTTSGNSEGFITKLDAFGNFMWAKGTQGSSSTKILSLAVDTIGDVYATGNFVSNTDFDPAIGTSYILTAANYTAFMLKLNAAGDFVWANGLNASVFSYGMSIAVDGFKNVHTSGYFQGLVDFDQTALGVYNTLSLLTLNTFVHKMSQCVAPTSIVNTTPLGNLTLCANETTTLSATSSGTVNWYATPSSTVVLGTGLSFVTPGLSTGSYTYYAAASNTCHTSYKTPFTVTVNACTGLDELSKNLISIFPNPNNGIINIVLTSTLAQNSTLEIYDAIGKLVVKQGLANELNAVNMSDLESGIYIFKVINNSLTIKTGKLIKQ